MLNEDKMKLMTGIALFEKREGKRIFPVCRYFRSDYICIHMLRSLLTYSFCYVLCGVVWMMYNIERLLNSDGISMVKALAGPALAVYLAGLAAYEAVTWLVYARRYEYAERGMKVYLTKMTRLSRRYEIRNRSKEAVKEKHPS